MRKRVSRSRGMTLIEILVSVAISTILLAAAYSVYAAATSGWNKSRRRIDMHQRARVALDLMSRCLRCAANSDDPNQVVFEGLDQQVEGETLGAISSTSESGELDMDEVTFRTNAPIHLFGDQEIADQAAVSFYIDRQTDEETGEATSTILDMRVDDTYHADASTGGWVVEVADWVEQMNVSYFNGTDWVTRWTSTDGVPKAVEVGVVVCDAEGKETPMTFARVIPIQTWRELESNRPVASTGNYSFEQSRQQSAQNAANGEPTENSTQQPEGAGQ
ncbi:MAG: prepilin-type N-terminal cleavage/methylation domain-containing protein [Candidatus Sumerlaeota bacterium]|nr:prepilin-type N-terminal cleavage/methylation domain-containing protein [Candidatus Sumerlaeota bacterium]